MAQESALPPRYRVGFDLGGTKMLAVLYDEKWQQVARTRKRTRGADGPDATIQRIFRMVDELLEEASATPEQLDGIGAGCPGPVDLDKGIVLEAVNLGWKNVPLKKHLEGKFPCVAAVTNDVDAGVFGESQFGAGEGARTVLGVFPGTGIGGGCVYAGEIVRGNGISCMEIGHVQVRPEGKWCGCGRRGCLETEASRLAIAAEAAKAVFRGEAPKLRELVGADVSEIRSGALAKSIQGGDTVIKRIMVDAAKLVGLVVADLVHLISPDVIVLGGGLVQALPELWTETVRRTARRRVMPPYADRFKVRAATLGDDATARGAAAWSRRQAEREAKREAERQASALGERTKA